MNIMVLLKYGKYIVLFVRVLPEILDLVLDLIKKLEWARANGEISKEEVLEIAIFGLKRLAGLLSGIDIDGLRKFRKQG